MKTQRSQINKQNHFTTNTYPELSVVLWLGVSGRLKWGHVREGTVSPSKFTSRSPSSQCCRKGLCLETGLLKRRSHHQEPLGWALLQSGGCPSKKRRLGHRNARAAHTPREDHVQRQQEGSHLQAKERDLRGSQPPAP